MSQTTVTALSGGHQGSEADRVRSLPPTRPAPGVQSPGAATSQEYPREKRPETTATFTLAGHAGEQEVVLAYSKFTVDPETNTVAIAIVDAATQEVIRQVPPEEIIEMARMMKQQAERLGRPAPTPQLANAGGRVVDQRV